MKRLMLCVLLVLFPAAARGQLEFRQVARTGDTIGNLPFPVASFGRWVSINDSGQVGVAGQYVGPPPSALR